MLHETTRLRCATCASSTTSSSTATSLARAARLRGGDARADRWTSSRRSASICDERAAAAQRRPATRRAAASRTARCARRRASRRPTSCSARAAGWASPPRPKYGGQGLPHAVEHRASSEVMLRREPLLRHVRALTHGAYTALDQHATDELKDEFIPEARRRHLGGHHVPHRAAGRHRPRPGADEGGADRRRPTAPTRLTGSKIFISGRRPRPRPRTSSTWCWRACPTRRRASRGSACSSSRSCARRAASSVPERRHLRRASSTRWGSRRSSTCVINFDGADGLPGRRAEQGHEGRCSPS